MIWHFEVMDMALAKKALGGRACILGNLPVSVLCTGTPADVKEGCRKLIETCAPAEATYSGARRNRPGRPGEPAGHDGGRQGVRRL